MVKGDGMDAVVEGAEDFNRENAERIADRLASSSDPQTVRAARRIYEHLTDTCPTHQKERASDYQERIKYIDKKSSE